MRGWSNYVGISLLNQNLVRDPQLHWRYQFQVYYEIQELEEVLQKVMMWK